MVFCCLLRGIKVPQICPIRLPERAFVLGIEPAGTARQGFPPVFAEERQRDRHDIIFRVVPPDDDLCDLVRESVIVNIRKKIGCREHLMVRTLLRKPFDLLHSILHGIESVCPERRINGNAVLGLQIRLPRFLGIEQLLHHRDGFRADAFQVLGVIGKQPRPCADRTFDRRKPDQVLVDDRAEDRAERLRGAAVRVLADRLPQSLLQLCGFQQLAEPFVHFGIMAERDAPKNISLDIVFALTVQNVDDLLLDRVVAAVYGERDRFRQKAGAHTGIKPRIRLKLRRAVNAERIQNGHILIGVRMKAVYHCVQRGGIWNIAARPERTPVP